MLEAWVSITENSTLSENLKNHLIINLQFILLNDTSKTSMSVTRIKKWFLKEAGTEQQYKERQQLLFDLNGAIDAERKKKEETKEYKERKEHNKSNKTREV